MTLFGVVDSKHARDAVVAETRKVPGVRGVVDALQIVPAEKESAVAEKDEAIHARDLEAPRAPAAQLSGRAHRRST